MNNKNNDSAKNIGDKLNTGILNSLKEHYDLNKRGIIYLGYMMGLNSKVLANAANCTRTYVNQSIAFFKNSKKSRERAAKILADMPSWYKELCRNRLPAIAEAEARAIEVYLKKPEKLIEKPSLARQIKAAAGVVTEEDASPPTVNIREVRNLMIQMLPEARKLPPPKREVITVGEEPEDG